VKMESAIIGAAWILVGGLCLYDKRTNDAGSLLVLWIMLAINGGVLSTK
jgi:hypothetical protein